MKAGNAVRLIHRGGVRGNLEITGHGQATPTPLPGAPVHPAPSELADMVLTGLEVTKTDPPSMSVNISAGTYRISGTTYSGEPGLQEVATMSFSDPLLMSDPYTQGIMGEATGDYPEMGTDNEVMSDGFPPFTMEADTTYTLDPAPAAGYGRYDTFQIGTDGVIDYVKGSESSSNPTKPSIDPDHVQVGAYILVTGGMTSIDDGDIGNIWTTKVPSEMVITHVDVFEWDDGDDTPQTNITVKFYDQYGWLISGAYDVTLQLVTGTGQIYSGDTGWDSTLVSQRFESSSYNFKYERDQTILEKAPSFYAVAEGPDNFSVVSFMKLENEYGVEIVDTGSSKLTYVQQLTSAASVEVDWDIGLVAQITISHNVAFSFTGAVHGDKIILMVEQDGTGGYIPTWPASVKYGEEVTEIRVNETANKRSYIGFIYHGPSSSYDCVANVKGYPKV